jgi:hypothetical protein
VRRKRQISSVWWTDTTIWSLAARRRCSTPEQEFYAPRLPQIDSVLQTAHVCLLYDLKTALSYNSHLDAATDALHAGFDCVAQHLESDDLGLLKGQRTRIDVAHRAHGKARTLDSKRSASKLPVANPYASSTAEEAKGYGLTLWPGPPSDEEFDVVTSSFDARVFAHVIKDRMKSILDDKAICIGGYTPGALEAQGEALRHVLSTGPRKQESSARLVYLSRGASEAPTSFTAGLLAIGAKDHPIPAADCGNERHLAVNPGRLLPRITGPKPSAIKIRAVRSAG